MKPYVHPAMNNDTSPAPTGSAHSSSSLDFERFFKTSLDLLCTASLDTGCFVHLNEAWSRTLGYSEDELRASPFISFVHPDDLQATVDAASQLGKGGPLAHFRNRYRSKDGSWKWLEWSSSVSLEERLIYAAARDVTQQMELTENMAAQAKLLDTIAAGAPIVLSVFDKDGVFLKHTGGAISKLGLKHNQLVGKTVFETFEGAQEALRLILAALGEGKESQNIQDLGETVWANWIGPLKNPNGEIVGALAISTDVTERERGRKELEERLQVIEAQNAAIQAMAAPILEVWEGVLVLTVVGRMDAGRASLMQENLLRSVVEKRARFAVIDLTAVDTVDIETARYLLQLTRALRLLGTRAMISGIQPRVAQALYAHGGDFGEVVTVASLHSALKICMGESSRRGIIGETR